MRQLIFILLSFILINSCGLIIPKIIPFNDLPAPTGSFSVGTRVFNWEDNNREEWFTEKDGDFRKIVVQVWYPTEEVSGEAAPYLDFAQDRVKPISEQVELPPFMINHIKEVTSNSYMNAPLKPAAGSYPLVIFSHGLGGMRMQNTIQMEELASKGFIALAMDHTFDANVTIFNDGSSADYRSAIVGEVTSDEFWKIRLPQINTRVADVSFVLDNIQKIQSGDEGFWSKIDLGRVGIMGHSFGGGTAIVASSRDTRLDACIALDGWLVPIEQSIIKNGLNVPFLFMGQTHWTNPVNYENLDTLIAASTASAEKLILDGTKHFDYSDTPQFNTASSKFGISGSMDLDELRILLNSRIVSFFELNL
ncbi:MAG: dienelactone hydrolase family protein [Candidatus Marinimicrobia bacterium]|nr:dienelactone hydrolase family protein [Candidatus Neomarinimicrobiota bacterium]